MWDSTVPMIGLAMRLDDLGALPVFDLPQAYGWRFFQPGDVDHWVRIEQSAVHIVTDEDGVQRRGVFVKYGNVVQFKRIDPTFENDQYVIVPAKIQIGSDERSLKNEVLLYDEIITSGKDLYDGKLL